MAVTAGLCVLLLLALRAAAQNQLIYFEIGRGLKLDPKHPEAITSITWKHKGNIVAEYIKDSVPVDYLGDFKGRSEVDLTTGILTVSDMVKSDDGKFTVEINNRVLPVSFTAVGVRNLKDYPVEVTVRPKGCSSRTSRNCTLICGQMFEGAEPIQYFWKKGKTGQWQQGGKTMNISIPKNSSSFPHYTCKVKNPISEKESDPTANPFINSGPVRLPAPRPALLLLAALVIRAVTA